MWFLIYIKQVFTSTGQLVIPPKWKARKRINDRSVMNWNVASWPVLRFIRNNCVTFSGISLKLLQLNQGFLSNLRYWVVDALTNTSLCIFKYAIRHIIFSQFIYFISVKIHDLIVLHMLYCSLFLQCVRTYQII